MEFVSLSHLEPSIILSTPAFPFHIPLPWITHNISAIKSITSELCRYRFSRTKMSFYPYGCLNSPCSLDYSSAVTSIQKLPWLGQYVLWYYAPVLTWASSTITLISPYWNATLTNLALTMDCEFEGSNCVLITVVPSAPRTKSGTCKVSTS